MENPLPIKDNCTRGHFQFKDRVSWYMDAHYNDKTTMSVCCDFLLNVVKRIVAGAKIFLSIHIWYRFILVSYLKMHSSKKGIGGDSGDVVILIDINPFNICTGVAQTSLHNAKWYDKTQICATSCCSCWLHYRGI